MLTENVLGLVPLEALGARIPAYHVAAGIQHVDGIISDRIDEEPIAVALIDG
jgi:hypothetical protein